MGILETFELVTLKSGVVSLRSRDNLETFHPVTGPRFEAQLLHVQQQKLLERAAAVDGSFVIWDVGLGAAANALTALDALSGGSARVELHSFDRTSGPLEFALTQSVELGYVVGHEASLRELLDCRMARVSPRITWHFHEGDFRLRLSDAAIPAPHAILYDPYSPNKNIEMWTLDHFTQLFARLDSAKPCLLTNYTCSTAVRVTLLLAGFSVGVGCGVGEKVETTIASNDIRLLDRPLDREWLKRVRVSHSAAPLRGGIRKMEFITDDDFAKLAALPQFMGR